MKIQPVVPPNLRKPRTLDQLRKAIGAARGKARTEELIDELALDSPSRTREELIRMIGWLGTGYQLGKYPECPLDVAQLVCDALKITTPTWLWGEGTEPPMIEESVELPADPVLSADQIEIEKQRQGLNARARQITAQEADLQARANFIDQRRAELETLESQLRQRGEELAGYEKAIRDREENADRKEKELLDKAKPAAHETAAESEDTVICGVIVDQEFLGMIEKAANGNMGHAFPRLPDNLDPDIRRELMAWRTGKLSAECKSNHEACLPQIVEIGILGQLHDCYIRSMRHHLNAHASVLSSAKRIKGIPQTDIVYYVCEIFDGEIGKSTRWARWIPMLGGSKDEETEAAMEIADYTKEAMKKR